MGVLLIASGCRWVRGSASKEPAPSDAGPPSAPLVVPESAPAVPKGMVWIPSGALLAGTPPDQVPRKADREMPGEQVVLGGFFIDKFAFPNEEGAIPQTNVTRDEARASCEKIGKRLCSELEWERACKGPNNQIYEYGNRHQPAICRTGAAARPLPSGYQYSCRSDFGVHDMHGAIWEWTDSPWGRGTKSGWASTRGGNAPDGEVVGRCANAQGRNPNEPSRTLGFRCCSGPRNSEEVTLTVREGQVLRLINMPDRKLMRTLATRLPKETSESMKRVGAFHMVRLWEWKPVPNEDLLLTGGCAGVPPRRECGVLVVRRTLGKLDVLDWVGSGHFIPTVKLEYDPLRVWIYGGDKLSHYRKSITFAWGNVEVGAPTRSVKNSAKKDVKRR